MAEPSDRAHSLYVRIWKGIEGQNDSEYLQPWPSGPKAHCSVRKLLVCACVMGLQNNCTGSGAFKTPLRTRGISSSQQLCVTCLHTTFLWPLFNKKLDWSYRFFSWLHVPRKHILTFSYWLLLIQSGNSNPLPHLQRKKKTKLCIFFSVLWYN